MKSLVWFRRDLRLRDHAALSHATQNCREVYCVFVFDDNILRGLPKDDHRVYFIYKTLEQMNRDLSKSGGGVYLAKGDPVEIVPALASRLGVKKVFANRDYEQYAKKRDASTARKLQRLGVEFESFKDHVVFESGEIATNDGSFYKVFTPYKNSWLKRLENSEDAIAERPVNLKAVKYKKLKGHSSKTSLKDLGFSEPAAAFKRSLNWKRRFNEFLKTVDRYHQARDLLAEDGTSQMSVYLRFGNASVRELVRKLQPITGQGKQTWLSEIIWRDFYSGFLDVHGETETESYKFKNLSWEKSSSPFEKWKEGQTGVPVVDAAMRQLNQTGWMHNRGRMIAATYLTKIMLVDWKKGEQYFGEKLIDYDLASNIGGWQWCASTGTDAVPYFRIFNPYKQAERFDPDSVYIKRFVPELANLPAKLARRPDLMSEEQEKKFGFRRGKDYPSPAVDYERGRKRALKLYKEAANAKV